MRSENMKIFDYEVFFSFYVGVITLNFTVLAFPIKLPAMLKMPSPFFFGLGKKGESSKKKGKFLPFSLSGYPKDNLNVYM